MSPIPSSRAAIPFARVVAAAPALVVIAIVSVQFGAALAKQLFEAAGPGGVVFLRTLLGGLMFLALWRPTLRGYNRQAYGILALYGVNIAVMMLFFYAAIDRIPLGIAVAISFAGPLGVAVAGSRRPLDVVWVAFAGVGVLLLSPLAGGSLDPVGVLLSLGSATSWATYILLSKRITRQFHDNSNAALALAMCAAALVALPTGLSGAIQVLADPALMLLSLVVALLSSAIPFALEFHALKTLPPRVFGLLVSLEPVVAAIMGYLVLGEVLSERQLIGIALVTVAAVATARSA